MVFVHLVYLIPLLKLLYGVVLYTTLLDLPLIQEGFPLHDFATYTASNGIRSLPVYGCSCTGYGHC